MAKDISNSISKLESEAAWASAMAASDKKLVVVDIYSEWCGPCDAMLPTFAKVLVEFEGADDRILLASASISKLGSVIQPSLPRESPQVHLDKHGCCPLFALYRGKSCIAMVVGPDAAALLYQIALNIPDRQTKD
jgi:thiol-disulfide isomerase/thioredoxin